MEEQAEPPHKDLSKYEYPYYESCKCGKTFTLYTQWDNNPEYYTDVWIECDECGSVINFNLPVN